MYPKRQKIATIDSFHKKQREDEHIFNTGNHCSYTLILFPISIHSTVIFTFMGDKNGNEKLSWITLLPKNIFVFELTSTR